MYIVLTTHVISSAQDRVQSGDVFSFDSMSKLLIHPGDTYISCIINRNNKSECYYEGIGTVGEILSADDVTFYARLENYRRFENKVPLTLPDGKFAEHLGRENTGLNPFTSTRSVRLLKNDAYDYILGAGGRQLPVISATVADCPKLEEQLKNSIRSYFVGQTAASMFHIERISRRLGNALTVTTAPEQETDFFRYKPSSVAKTADLSALEIEKKLQQAQDSLAAEKRHREELEAALHGIKNQGLDEAELLKAALSQAEARYQELLLQQQHTEEQLLDFQESYRLIERKLADAQKQISTLESQLNSIENQRSALQAEVDVSAARIRALEQALADLERQYGEEKNIRKHVETSLVNLEEALTLAEQAHSLETESNWGQIMELKDQLKSSKIQRGSLQTALNEANARVESLSRECSDLAQRYQNEARCRNEAEATVLMQRESYAQSEQILREQNENQAEVMASLRKQIDDAETQKKALQAALDESAVRIETLTKECSGLAQQRDAEVMIRTQLESELSTHRDQQKLLENTHAEEDHQHSVDISRLERRVRALEQQNELLVQDLYTSEYQIQGLCRHCGGAFSGFLRKKCSVCGCVKDY